MPSTTKTLLLAGMLCTGVLLAGCEKPTQPTPPELQPDNKPQPASKGEDKFSQVEKAYANVEPVGEQQVEGRIQFYPDTGQTRMVVKIKLSGLTPGKHGFHIHERPDCGDGAMAAGGHFNPQQTRHGAPDSEPRHTGDMGNITADENGEVEAEIRAPGSCAMPWWCMPGRMI